MKNGTISCLNCFHAPKNEYKEAFGALRPYCTLTNTILLKDLAAVGRCKFYNKDVANMRICGNCTHFLGGGDWGLSCAKSYSNIVNSVCDACDLFESKYGK